MSTLQTERAHFEAALLALLGNISGGVPSQSRQAIIDYVKAKLDELIPQGEGVTFSLSTDPNISNPLDLLINAHLDECTKDICLSAPLSVLYPQSADVEGVAFSEGSKTGYVVLPLNFLRLSSFKMSDWTREINIPIKTENPEYLKQSNIYLRGTVNKPVAAINWKTVTEEETASQRRILEYYSVNLLHTVDKLLYIPESLTDDFILVNPNLLDSLAWQTAGKIMQITGLMDGMKIAQERVIQSYNNL
jgi:hypothetical protein